MLLLGDNVLTSQEPSSWLRVTHVHLLPDFLPHLWEELLGPGHLEVVNIDNQEDAILVEVATAPTRIFPDWLETELDEAGITMLFPASARVGVAVKGFLEQEHGFLHTLGLRGELVPWHRYVSWRARELSLDVGLVRVCYLARVTWKLAIVISDLGCLDLGRVATQIAK